MTYTAGDVFRAGPFREQLPLYGIVPSAVVISLDDIGVIAAGLSVIVEANSTYAMDGYIAYSSAATPDIKFRVDVPFGATGHWGLYPVSQTATTQSGDLEAFRVSNFDDYQGAGGAPTPEMICQPHGYIATASEGGAVQFEMAQITSTGTVTVLEAGSWIRLTKIT